MSDSPLTVYSTCPPSNSVAGDVYSKCVEVARISESHGCEGILVYTDNGLLDPWAVSQLILENTKKLVPLVAVQPIYMHPYAAAKKAATFAQLYGRRIDYNMLAGGFKNDLAALDDHTPHDDRYGRTGEYTQIIQLLLSTNGPVTYQGEYYRAKNLKMTPPMPEELYPRFMISGSSPAGLEAAIRVGAIAVQYPKPAKELKSSPPSTETGAGFRVGVIAREDGEEAWRIAHERFPPSKRGQATHKLATKVSDSHWHRQLADLAGDPDSVYWLEPYRNYNTFCPYLVGDFDLVAEELASYMRVGFTTMITDVPREPEDLIHCREALRRAAKLIES